MIINNNIPALNTHRQMGINQGNMQSAMEKLSSGLRINRAGDDAAGLAISEKMRAQINGLDQASRNAQDGISLIQTAEGALDETHNILQRMRELAVQSSNDTNVGVDREELQKEVDQLASEISRISDTTEFNTQNLLNGDFADKKFHIGANAGQDITLNIADMSASALNVEGVAREAVASQGTIQGMVITAEDGTNYNVSIVQASEDETALGASLNGNTITITLGRDDSGDVISSTQAEVVSAINTALTDEGIAATLALDEDGEEIEGDVTVTTGTGALTGGTVASNGGEGTGINISTQESASEAITVINAAIERVSAERSMLGSYQNRLEHTIANLDNSSENLSAAESRIRDVDMAKEMMEMTRANILSQASQSMLAQANQQPQSVLQLLG